MASSGYQRPNPMGDDLVFPVPAGVILPSEAAGGPGQGPGPAQAGTELGEVRQNTSQALPPVPQQAQHGMDGIETLTTVDNI